MSAPSLRERAVTGVRWTLVSTVVSTVGQAAQLLVLSRVLGPADFGLMGVLLIVTGFALAYTDLGISAAIIQRRDATHDQLSSLYWLNVVLGLAVATLVVLLAPWLAAFFRAPAVIAPLRVTALLFVIVPLGKQFEMLLQRDLRFSTLARIEVAATVVGVAVAIGTALRGAGVWALVAGTLAGAAVRSLQLAALGWRRSRPSLRFRRADLRGYVSFGLFQVGEQTINYFGERLDQLIIGRLLGVTSLGFYNFAFNLTSQPISRINPVVTRVAYPTFCLVQEDSSRLRSGFLRVVALLATVNAPLLLGLAAVAPGFVPLAFGAQWRPGVPLVQLLCVLALLRSVGNPVGSVLLARGRADLGFRLNLCLIALNLPAVAVGAWLGGTVGIVLGLLAVQLLLLPISYVWLLRPLLGRFAREYAATIARPTVLAALMAGIVAALPGAVGGSLSPWSVTLLQVVVGALVYGGALLAADREGVRQLASLAGARS